jgi:hypothetical protein
MWHQRRECQKGSGPRLIWNRCYAHTNRDALNVEYDTGRYTLTIPAYTFDKVAGEKAAEDMAAVALMQGRVEFKDHSKDNPDRQNEICGMFFSPLGLDVLRDAAEKSLGAPLGPTKNRACVKIPELHLGLSSSETALEMTGDTKWIGDYMPMCKGEIKAMSVNGVPFKKVVFPLEEQEFVITALQKFSAKMGYKLNVNLDAMPMLQLLLTLCPQCRYTQRADSIHTQISYSYNMLSSYS